MTQARSLFGRWKNNAAQALTLVIGLFALISTDARAEWHGGERPIMGTEIRVWFWHEDTELANQLVQDVFDEAERINQMMSTYIETSLISDVNGRAHEGPVEAGDELFYVVERAIDISVLTLGAFDITYESVGQHYDFREGKRPDADTLTREVGKIDFRFIKLDEDKKTIEFEVEGVRINLGGIAKGYFVERGVDILREAGVEHGIVTAGGDSRLIGDRRGRPWMVGIRDPREDGQVAISVPLEGEAISTSGDYERYFEEEGVRYHHIISPESGEPVAGVHSATVFGPDAVMTDALSTSVFVMGVEEGLTMIGCLPDYEGIVIDSEGQIWYSTGLENPSAPLHDKPATDPEPGTC